MVGNIASGKSAYCRNQSRNGVIICNDDSIVNSLHANDYTLYNERLKPLYKSVENTIITTALAMGHAVVIDRPNHTRAMRRRYISLARSFDVPSILVETRWEDPLVHARRRVNSDNRGYDLDYWHQVAKYFQSGYEEPNQEIENFDKLILWDYKDDQNN